MSRSLPAAIVLGSSILVAAVIRAGPLSPPGGPVASSYKTLGEVEPRIAVNAQNTPGSAPFAFVITQPGSYYLPADVSVPATGAAILVVADDVTLDLSGFQVVGATSGQVGIQVSASGCLVRNGTIRGFAHALSAVDANIVEDLRIAACPMGITIGDRCRASRLSIRDAATGWAIQAGSFGVVENCLVAGSPRAITANGAAVIRGCQITGATTTGIGFVGASVVADNRLRGSETGTPAGTGIASTSFGSRIENNTVSFFSTGVSLTTAPNTVVHNVLGSCLTNITAASNNLVGPVLTGATMASNTNPDANYDN